MYCMAFTGRVITNDFACSYVTDFIEIGQPDLQKPVQILCQMHDNSIPFQWDYIQRKNASVTTPYITNYISKLSLECFKDQKEYEVCQLSRKDNYSLIAFYNYVPPK